ncbi:M20/M25/M40 family metallo-hydrolase [Neobacillus sp. NPDC097160]|uniref:M20/M25/M40 family metallo-hydrolase n=1 Tax=Neobacillus sp. NPDC097160 TaxID=3364298 RepID=UPI00382DB777
MKKGTKIVGTTVLIGSLLAASHSAFAETKDNPSQQAFDNKVVKRIDVDRIYENVSYLAETIGPRVAGTAKEDQTVEYIANQFKQYGFNNVEIQPFKIVTSYNRPTTASFSVNETSYQVTAFGYSQNTPSGGMSSKLVYVGLGSEAEVAGKDVSGKIALVHRGGGIPFATKMSNAKNAGASGVVIINDVAGLPTSNLAADESNLPTLFMTKAEGDALVSTLGQTTLTGTMRIEGAKFTMTTSHNVIATKKPQANKDTKQIIMVGAHHDSVAVGTGASDNASGTSVLLELARVLANTPTDTEIRFITFGAEERGLLGSYHYTKQLSKDEINRTVAMLNMDMVGSKNAGKFAMFTVDGKPNTVTTLGNSAGTRLYEAISYNQVGRSDHQPFTEVGIPAAVFSYAPLEPEYHSPNDKIELISKEKLLKTAQVLGAAIYQAARPDTPALERSKVAPIPIEAELDGDLHL